MDRFTSMSVFVRAAEARSFTGVAEEFAISPTMVGKHIKALEERVGARLLNRTTRRQSLTEIGRIYYERCRQILSDADAAEASANELQAAPRGLLRINAPVTFGSQRLTAAVCDFMRLYPEVEVNLVLSDRIVDLVEEGYEAAIRVGPLADSELIARKLAPYRMAVAASPAYLAEFGRPQAPEELGRHNCVGFAYWAERDRWIFHKGERQETVQIKARLTSNNGQALRNAALAGVGIVMQGEVLLAEDIAAGRLVAVLPDWQAPSRPMHVLFLPDRRPTPKLRAFIDFIVARFG
jgi:DNA-binding transcriptional LysR family regulator